MNKDKIITILVCTFFILFAVFLKATPVCFYYQGKSALDKKDYIKAHKCLKNAYNFDKKNKDYRYYYVQSLLRLSPTVTVQKEMFNIASSDDKDSAQTVAEAKIAEWRNNILSNIGNNYIEQAPSDKGIVRWSIEKFPLKIALVNQSNVEIPEYYNNEVYRAFSQWEVSSQILKFSSTNNANDADILVKFENLPNDVCDGNGCKYVVGFTTPSIKNNILKKMIITLYTKDPNGNYFSDKELYNTILHEAGHALGIMGHSYSSDDLMYMATEGSNFYTPYRSSFQYLSSQDINTIKLLYKLVPAITNSEKVNTKGLVYAPIVLGTSKEISLRKLKDAQNYVKSAPDIPGGYVDLGIAYAELNKTHEAVKALQKALTLSKSDSDKYISYFNIAVVFVNSGDTKNALEYALKAQSISNNDEINELITNIRHAQITKSKPFKF
mgnify:FL=1